MSASRANASARNRRAGGIEIAPPQQQQNARGAPRPGQNARPGRGGQQQSQIPQSKPQISISDAIGLVSLRIGRLEQFMFKINHEGIPNSEDLNLSENERIVDENVFRSIVSRIEQLEESASNSGCNNQITSSNTPEINIENHPFVVELNKKINAQQTSIYELKDMILKMQNFAMETSISLKALVEQYESDKLYESQELLYNIDNNFVEGENLEPSEVIEEVTQLSNLNKEDLEEMLKNELSEEF